MEVCHLDELPTDAEVAWDILLCQFFRAYEPNDSLIRDLWNIVLSFFFGFTKDLLISVPLRAIVPDAGYEICEFVTLLPPFDRYLSYFYGWEDGGEIQLILKLDLSFYYYLINVY
jgi:hypothetical protein